MRLLWRCDECHQLRTHDDLVEVRVEELIMTQPVMGRGDMAVYGRSDRRLCPPCIERLDPWHEVNDALQEQGTG